VLLTDLAFPGMSGIELIGNVKQKYPGIDVMAHTASESRESAFSAIKAGASAYIIKGGEVSPGPARERGHEGKHRRSVIRGSHLNRLINQINIAGEVKHFYEDRKHLPFSQLF